MLAFEPEKHQARRGSIDHMTQQRGPEQRQERNVTPDEVTVLPEKRFREAVVVFDLE